MKGVLLFFLVQPVVDITYILRQNDWVVVVVLLAWHKDCK
jgi:hypothetical protein